MLSALSVLSLLDRHRGALFPWVAVLYGAGIGVYLSASREPMEWIWWGLAAGILVLLALTTLVSSMWRPMVLIVLIPALGFAVAALRSHGIAEPKLGFRYYGPIEGRVIGIDRSQSDAVRLTLDKVVLADVDPNRTPTRVRVSLHGDYALQRPQPGAVVGLTGHLSPPGGPVEPGGFDFRRHAWFLKLGAVGYTRNPVVTLARPEGGTALAVLRLRFRIGDGVRAVLPGEAGGFAVAITTGDRSSLDQPTLEILRATNLAHLLAISGLHMGLLTGVVFLGLRIGLSSVRPLSLRWPVKKIAALGALLAGGIYLVLSGNNVATERAYVMVAVMLTAVLVDRRAISLRAVALAALLVLTLRPETLVGPGFQMSFAATTALVTVYGWLRDRDWSQNRWPWGLRLIGGVALSSAVAGLATAPIAAAHFNQIPHYGLVANVLSVPLMGLVIIPGAVLAAVLWPLGLSWIGLFLMEPAINWILGVARVVASWEGALSFVQSPHAIVLPLLALGGAMLACLRDRSRSFGLPVLLTAFALWALSERPQVLISETGGQVGVVGTEGRVISRARGDGFATRNWLENDGDPVAQDVAAARTGWREQDGARILEINGHRLVHGTGIMGSAAAVAMCDEAIVVVNVRVDAPQDCVIFDEARLAETGAVALNFTKNALRTTEARQLSLGRPWSQ